MSCICHNCSKISSSDLPTLCILRDSHTFCSLITHSHMSHKCHTLSLFPSITHAILFHQIHGYMSIPNDIPTKLFRENSRIKNVESIYHLHSGKIISRNLAPFKTQIFSPWAQQFCVLGNALYSRCSRPNE